MKNLWLAVALAAVACGGPGYRIVKQAPPSELAGKGIIQIARVDYSQGNIDGHSEVEYASAQDAEGQRRWGDVKSGIDEDFGKALASKGSGLTFVGAGVQAALVVKPIVRFINPGSFLSRSELRLAVQITTPDGNVLDEIELANGTAGNIYNATDEKRLRQDAENIGERVGRYLAARARP